MRFILELVPSGGKLGNKKIGKFALVTIDMHALWLVKDCIISR